MSPGEEKLFKSECGILVISGGGYHIGRPVIFMSGIYQLLEINVQNPEQVSPNISY